MACSVQSKVLRIKKAKTAFRPNNVRQISDWRNLLENLNKINVIGETTPIVKR